MGKRVLHLVSLVDFGITGQSNYRIPIQVRVTASFHLIVAVWYSHDTLKPVLVTLLLRLLSLTFVCVFMMLIKQEFIREDRNQWADFCNRHLFNTWLVKCHSFSLIFTSCEYEKWMQYWKKELSCGLYSLTLFRRTSKQKGCAKDRWRTWLSQIIALSNRR